MKLVSRIILGAVFCASAISKLFSVESFDLYIFSFQLFSFDLSSLFARLLIICELLLGLGLMSGFWRRTVNWCCVAMLGVFSAILVWRWAIGDTGSCHCFGDVLDMNPWQSLLKNAGFSVLLALGWKAPKKDWLPSRMWRGIITAAVSILVTLTVFLVWTPGIWWRWMGHHSTDLVEEQWQPYSEEYGYNEGRQVVLFLSPLCEHCQHCISKVSTIISRHDLPKDRIHSVFMILASNPEENPLLLPYFYEKAGIEDPGLDTHHISVDDFIPMTDGSMPLICLFEDGVLVTEYSYNTLDEKAFVEFLKGE